MKKLIVCMLLISMLLLGACGAGTSTSSASDAASTPLTAGGNFSDEMKIANPVDLDPVYGADSVERQGDHPGSPYFSQVDVYNLTGTDTLTILPKFKTLQQSCEWSCGVDAALMVLNYFGAQGEHNEQTLAQMRSNALTPAATTLRDVARIFETVGGFDVETSYDHPGDELYEYMTLDKIREFLGQGLPVIAAWNDWGGHWQVIIGYDTMGTETQQDDVIIVADSYDTTDHNQDGYGIYGAERFYYNWTMYDFFTSGYGVDERDLLFCVVKPQQ